MNRLKKFIKTIRQLGIQQTSFYALYQLGLRTGHYRRVLANKPQIPEGLNIHLLLPLPSKEAILSAIGQNELDLLLAQADRIVQLGEYRQFGGAYTSIALKPPVDSPMQDWTQYETGKAQVNTEDIKFVWEPARFGWAVLLARAYHLTKDEKYAQTFWKYLDEFQRENPYLQGPNWQSGQEAATRLMTVLLCAAIFTEGRDKAHQQMLPIINFVIQHAKRIPPTLLYARAQHNNHLVTEALGLLCAGYALPAYREARRWKALGRRWLEESFRTQITDTGEYIQYSNNYHRVMLQSATLATAVLHHHQEDWSAEIHQKLQSATKWLAAEVDPSTGRAANYGHNDGAYLFPFANGGFSDYRPVVQAAANLFFQKQAYPTGKWDEMALWMNSKVEDPALLPVSSQEKVHLSEKSWASLRGHDYTSRPGHADQNHVDLWWHGQPVALDAGTYRYTAESPWDNQLMTTQVHNTLTINGQDQMTRASRFLWLDWSAGKVTREGDTRLTGIHDGYQQYGILHKRVVDCIQPDQWMVGDELISILRNDDTWYDLRVHWLLPDWDWQIDGSNLMLQQDSHVITIKMIRNASVLPQIQLCRTGEIIWGEGECRPQMGWYSPTYSIKEPALSFVYQITSKVPVRISSNWHFEER